ncbi:MAG: addiction module toxin RelE [Nanoarchaeota archaeon]
MRKYEIKPHLLKILNKLSKKDKSAYEAVMGKINEIINASPNEIEHYKNLKYNLKFEKRVHIASHFVLVFSYDKSTDFISFLDYDHHDNIYGR